MRILDENDVEIFDPDYEKGYTEEEDIFKQHHEAILPIEEIGHYEVIKTFPNGGQTSIWVVDVPGVPGQEAWDEYETILRYHLYPEEHKISIDNIQLNEIFIFEDQYYQAIETILRGEELVLNKNCKLLDIVQILSDLLNKGE